MIKNLLAVLKLIKRRPRCVEQWNSTGPIARVVLLFLISSLGINHSGYAQELSPDEVQIVDYVSQNSEQALVLLEKVVNINSGTLNHQGVREVGKVFRKEFDAIGFKTKWLQMPDSINRAGHLVAERSGNRGKRLLIIGHLDTVFEKDNPFQTFTQNDTVAYGPGVVDMKSSNVIIVYALKALHEFGLLDGAAISVAFTGDEEKVGSPLSVSRRDLIEIAQRSDIALGFEEWANGGKSATVARRGSSQWSLHVAGIRAHSSDIFSEEVGSGAIFEAARILNTFYEELRGEKYLTFNPGAILGGTEVEYDFPTSRGTVFGKTNVIAQTVTVDGGLRFISEEQKEDARARMRQIISQNLPGTSAKITFADMYPAMSPTEGNLKLLEVLNGVSIDLGHGTIDALDASKRGAADISFVGSYVDALAGLGAVGSGSHTEKESLDLRLFPKITQRIALLIYRLTR